MKVLLRFFVAILFVSVSSGAFSQINVIRHAAEKAKSVGEQKTNDAIDQGIDNAANGSDADKKDAQNDDNASQQKDDNQEDNTGGEAAKSGTAQQEQTPLQSYSKFDFVPGQKVIYYEDFSQDNVGDFPAVWNTNGSGEVVTNNLFPGHWLQIAGEYCVWTDNLLDLPDNYTIEYDAVPARNEEGNMSGYTFRLMQCTNVKGFDYGSVPGQAGFEYWVEYFGRPGYRTYMNNDEGANLGLSGNLDGEKYKQQLDTKYHISIWVQKSRIRLYQNELKVVDLPKAFNVAGVKMDRIRFEEGSVLVSNIRVAIGAPDTRNKLLTEGKLVTYGIYFDVNKDVVKPESYGTLKDISTILTENPDVRVKIIGYTDADGNDAANLDLSKRRAASVKEELTKSFGIDATRLESDGMGEANPVAPNDTPSNKALNRRVELIKL
jgi:OmpA-OmpF porin, OOP family